MATHLTKEQKETIIQLYKEGFRNFEISKKTGISRMSITRRIRLYKNNQMSNRDLGNLKRKQERDILREKIVADRLVMKRMDVAKKYNITGSYVYDLLKDHPLKNKFYKEKQTPPRKAKPTILKKTKKDIPPKPIEKTLPTKQPGPQKPVRINNKTTIYVSVNDQKSTDQIIQQFNSKFNRL